MINALLKKLAWTLGLIFIFFISTSQQIIPDISLENFEARVINKTDMSIIGQKYEADIVLVPKYKNLNPIVEIEGQEIGVVDGVGKYRSVLHTIGERKFKGRFRINGAQGPVYFPFEGVQTGTHAAANFYLAEADILYIGYPNKLSVAVPGINPNNIRVTCQGGRVTKEGSHYKLNVERIGNVTVKVAAVIDGRTRILGSMRYRARKMPKPKIHLGVFSGNSPCAKEAIMAQTRLICVHPPHLAAARSAYKVVSYDAVLVSETGRHMASAQGSAISDMVKVLMKKAEKGDMIIFKNIRTTSFGPTITADPIIIEFAN